MDEDTSTRQKGGSRLCRSTPFRDLPHLLTIQELCDVTGIGRNTAYAIAHAEFEVVWIGRRIFVTKDAVGKRFRLANDGDAGAP